MFTHRTAHFCELFKTFLRKLELKIISHFKVLLTFVFEKGLRTEIEQMFFFLILENFQFSIRFSQECSVFFEKSLRTEFTQKSLDYQILL